MKADAIDNVPMFDIAPPPTVRNPESGIRFGPRTIRRVLCAAGAHTAGLILGDGEHVVWRPHLVHSATGASWQCSAVGKCLCDAPAPNVAGVHTPTCTDPVNSPCFW